MDALGAEGRSAGKHTIEDEVAVAGKGGEDVVRREGATCVTEALKGVRKGEKRWDGVVTV